MIFDFRLCFPLNVSFAEVGRNSPFFPCTLKLILMQVEKSRDYVLLPVIFLCWRIQKLKFQLNRYEGKQEREEAPLRMSFIQKPNKLCQKLMILFYFFL